MQQEELVSLKRPRKISNPRQLVRQNSNSGKILQHIQFAAEGSEDSKSNQFVFASPVRESSNQEKSRTHLGLTAQGQSSQMSQTSPGKKFNFNYSDKLEGPDANRESIITTYYCKNPSTPNMSADL